MTIAQVLSEIQANGTLRSLDPALIQAIYRWFESDPHVLPEIMSEGFKHGGIERFLLFGEALLFQRQHDLLLKHIVDGLEDLRVQDLKFRAIWYSQHGYPPNAELGAELFDFTCPIPATKLDILPGGHCHSCCAVWMPMGIGNLFTDAAPWNSQTAMAIRAGVNDGSFRYCGKEKCAYIKTGSLPLKSVTDIPEVDHPKHINLSYDRTCNLACPTCRLTKIVAGKTEQEFLASMTEERVIPLLRNADSVHITGAGDPFASRTYWNLLKRLTVDEFPNLRVSLMTNGVLFDDKIWESIEHLRGRIDAIHVSVDAATEETYSKIRVFGDWDRLLENLPLIAKRTREGFVGRFLLCFVVQVDNYREMPAFLKLARQVDADDVHFQQINDWGTFPREEYLRRAVQLPGHPEHAEFAEVLRQLSRVSGPRYLHEFTDIEPRLNFAKTAGDVCEEQVSST